MKFRHLVPVSIKLLYHKLRWIGKNFGAIHYTAELKQPERNHFHGPITYDTDSLKTSNNCDFIKEPRFAKAYAEAAATKPWDGFTLQWRTYIVCWLADYVKELDGDFVECGVNTGAYSKAVISYVDFNHLNKTFFLLDTFEGMVEELVSEAEKKAGVSSYFGSYKDVYEQVRTTFKNDKVKMPQYDFVWVAGTGDGRSNSSLEATR